jgi:hypothetical protein
MTVTDRSDRLISRAAGILSVFLVVLFLGTVGALAWPRVSNALGLKSKPEPAYKAGDVVDVPREWYSGASHTLIILARADCGACVNAKPFFKSLVSRVQAAGNARVVLGGVSAEQRPDVAYAKAIGLDAGMARTTKPKQLRLKSVPTLLLVSVDGRITGAWDSLGPDKQHPTADAKQQAIAEEILTLIGRWPTNR